jgi:hypothetical protein
MKRQALVAPSTMKCHRRQQQQQQQHHWKASPTCSSESDPEIVRLKAVLGSTTTSQPKYRVGRVKKRNQRYYTDDFIVDPILEDCGDTTTTACGDTTTTACGDTTTACGDTTTTVLHELKSWIGFRRTVVRRKRPRRVVPSLVMERQVMGMGGCSDGGTNNEAAGNNVLTLCAGQLLYVSMSPTKKERGVQNFDAKRSLQASKINSVFAPVRSGAVIILLSVSFTRFHCSFVCWRKNCIRPPFGSWKGKMN